MRPHGFVLAAFGLTLLATACSGSSAEDPGPVFDNEDGRTVACMVHQPTAPGSRYTDPQRRDTAQVLAVLHYYTVNGVKPYCDQKQASEVYRSWAALYVHLGADPAAVRPLLPAR